VVVANRLDGFDFMEFELVKWVGKSMRWVGPTLIVAATLMLVAMLYVALGGVMDPRCATQHQHHAINEGVSC